MAILKFFPYESFYIVSKLPPDTIQARLQNELTFSDAGSGYADAEADTYFKGFAGKGKFDIKPYVNYGNAFLPKIKGSIDPYQDGSRVTIKMTLSSSAAMFMTVWMTVVGAGCIAVVLTGYPIIVFKGVQHYINNFNFLVLIPFVMFILGHVLTFAAFKQESKKARVTLLELFEGVLQKI